MYYRIVTSIIESFTSGLLNGNQEKKQRNDNSEAINNLNTSRKGVPLCR